MMTLIYHDEHKFFRQPIYQSIHHALNFHFLTTMVVIDAHLMYISSSTLTRCLLAILVSLLSYSTKIANKNRVKCWRWYIYQYGINDNHSHKKMKIQGMMNRLIYWLSEELIFVMIYQRHHCQMLLLVRRQQKHIFVRESTLFTI